MAKKKNVKYNPASKEDKGLNVACAEFAADREKSELKIGENFEFENDLLLKSFGFELDNSGTMTMKVQKNDKIHIEEKTNEIERVVGGKTVSTAKVSKDKMDRMIEEENKRQEKRSTEGR
ncbi:MAG: hypothetical protein HFJ50_02905 [Clostridia bacterium]|jgi:hypothetical protein|nr:hypothetical protein [Clostridia bacterium]